MGDGIVQGINDTTLYAEKIYSQNFTQPSKKFILSLHFNGDDSYLFVNGKQELKFKCKTESLVKERFTEVYCFAVTTVNFINDIVFIFCSYLIFRFTKEFTQRVFSIES